MDDILVQCVYIEVRSLKTIVVVKQTVYQEPIHMTLVKQKWLLSYSPIILFAVIAANHFYWVHQAHLSPWLGGGYGMFSTTDYGPSRYIKVYALQDNIIQEEIEIPEYLSMLARKTRGLPDDKNVLSFALAIENYLNANQHGYPVIRIEVLNSHYDSETLHPTYKKLNVIDYQNSRFKKP